VADQEVAIAVKLHLNTLLELFSVHEAEKAQQVKKIINVMTAVLSVAEKKEKWPTWKKSDTESVYKHLSLPERPDKLNPAYKKELYQTNRMLCRVFDYLKKKTGMKVAKMPPLNFFPRAHQAVVQDDEAFELLDEYHQILTWYQSRRPNYGANHDHLRQDSMLIFIAFDGVLRKDADYRLAYLQEHQVCCDSGAHIKLPLGKKAGYVNMTRVYPIGSLSQSYLKILLPRVKRVQGKFYLFPREWRQKTKAKVSRRVDLDERLQEVWRIVHPGKAVPAHWNIGMWIRLGQMSLSQSGVPYMAIAALTGKLRTAHLQREPEYQPGIERIPAVNKEVSPEKKSESVYDVKHDLLAEMLFLTVRSVLLRRGYKEWHMGPKKEAAAEIVNLMSEYAEFLECTPNVRLLLDWVVWMLSGQKYRKNKISTFLGYISVLPCRLLPIMGNKIISDLSIDEWTELASYMASDMEYAASSRRQTMTHLKSFYEFLEQSHQAVPGVAWDNYAFRISKEIPEAYVVSPAEVDVLLASLDSGDHRWVAIILAFYGGLRCEEICGLKPSDLLDDYKLQIGWSKRQTSRRSVPIGWLIPEPYWPQLLKIIKEKRAKGNLRIVSELNGEPIRPNTLGKRIARMLATQKISISGIHSLRHGFASWVLMRYFMMVDPGFYSSVLTGDVCGFVDHSAPIFTDTSFIKLARTFGGAVWEHDWMTVKCCPGKPTDIAVIAMLLGHTNRFTPTENYFNSMEWVVRHYLNQRYARIAALA